MENLGTKGSDLQNDQEKPEWHPYRVWQNQIRSQQPDQIVERGNNHLDTHDATGSWKTRIGNI